jgi:hypothetical protein
MKRIYSYRIQPGASRVMEKILKYAEQANRKMDGKECRVTKISYTNEANLKHQYLVEFRNDSLYQVNVLGIQDKSFLLCRACWKTLKMSL